MRRLGVALLALGLLATACGRNSHDRYAPKFGAAQRVAAAAGVAALAVDDAGQLYYGTRTTGDVFVVDPRAPKAPRLAAHVDVGRAGQRGLLSIATRGRELFLSYTRASDGRLEVQRIVPGGDGRVIWTGPVAADLANGGHLAFDTKDHLVIGLGENAGGRTGLMATLSIAGPPTQKPVAISRGWHNPFGFTIDSRGRLWVADNAPGDDKELVARGRERDGPKRRRFATALPSHSAPSGLTSVRDELFLCSYNRRIVYRLHAGPDNVARLRGAVLGLRCLTGVVSLPDGSIVTATADDIRRYPPR